MLASADEPKEKPRISGPNQIIDVNSAVETVIKLNRKFQGEERTERFLNLVSEIEVIPDLEERETKREFFTKGLEEQSDILFEVCNNLIKNKNYIQIMEIVDSGYFGPKWLPYWIEQKVNFFHEEDIPEGFLLELIRRSDDPSFAEKAFKRCFANPDVFKGIMNGQYFPNLSEEGQKNIRDYAKAYYQCLTQEPIIETVEGLKFLNKFVTGIERKNKRFCIIFGDCERLHKDILGKSERDLYRTTITGGWMSIKKMDEKNQGTNIDFYSRSIDFGKYNYLILEKFREEIRKNLQETLGEEKLQLTINQSQ